MKQRKTLFFCKIAVFVFLSPVKGEDFFTYTSSGGITYTICEQGISQINLGEKTLAKGKWLFEPVDWMFIKGGRRDSSWQLLSAKLQKQAENSVLVSQVYSGAKVYFRYTFKGEDLYIESRVENEGEKPIGFSRFGHLTFDFQANPEGIMPVWHISYLQVTGYGCFHPSHLNRIAGSYSAGKDFGVGLSPSGRQFIRTLFLWDLPDWGKQEIKNPRHLCYLVAEPIPAEGARTFQMVMRVSTRKDWQHLLQPYQEYFQRLFGQVKYVADYRLLAVSHVNRNVESISPENPYGFHPGFRRLDLVSGTNAFCDLLVPALKKANGQGVLIWGQTGTDPRGAMYRPDFDVLPPEVETNWATIDRNFREAGLRHGVCTRPGEIAVRINWKKDGTVRINPDDSWHLNLLWQRFQKMINLGCTVFYLDSFGNSWEDVKIMQFLREKMGPEIQTFAEHQCDVLMVYSGAYTETDFYEKGKASWVKETNYYPRAGLRNWEIYQWLVPGVQMVSRLYDIHGTIPKDFLPVERFFYDHRITPLVADYRLPERADFLRVLQEEYLEGTNRWKK